MMMLFMLISLSTAVLSYMSLDPMKSSFFLILSMLLLMPCVSFGINVWFSYFISLLFLSGIFVILVYFSSLSSFNIQSVKLNSVLIVLTAMMMTNVCFFQIKNLLSLNSFYYSLYYLILCFLIMMLVIFMNFVSYFLSFSGALRKL